MPRISEFTTEVGASTSDLILNVGSTTRRANLSQIVGGIFTSQGQIAYADSSRNAAALNPPTSGAVLAYSSATSAPTWSIPTSGSLFTVSSAGLPAWQAAPTSGAVLVYSTASTRPDWLIPTSGGLFTVSSAGVPSWLAAPTSGAILTYSSGSTSPAWLAAGSSGSILRSASAAGSAPEWLGIGTSGQVLESTGGMPQWRAGVAGAGTTETWQVSLPTSVNVTTAAYVALNWTQEDFDTDAFHTTVGGSASAVTITLAGTYLIGVQWESVDPTNIIALRLFEGSTILFTGVGSTTPAAAQLGMFSVLRRFPTSGTVLTVGALSRPTTAELSTQLGGVRWWGHRISPGA